METGQVIISANWHLFQESMPWTSAAGYWTQHNHMRLQPSPWWNCWFAVTCGTAQWWGLNEWPRHHRTQRPPEQLVMRRLFGTLCRTNEGDSFTLTHAAEVWTESILALTWSFYRARAHICSVCWCYVLMRASAKNVNTWNRDVLLATTRWVMNTQPLVSDDISTWLRTALHKSASECRHTHKMNLRIHTKFK